MPYPRVSISRLPTGEPAVYVGGIHLPVTAVIRAKDGEGRDIILLALPTGSVEDRIGLDSLPDALEP